MKEEEGTSAAAPLLLLFKNTREKIKYKLPSINLLPM